MRRREGVMLCIPVLSLLLVMEARRHPCSCWRCHVAMVVPLLLLPTVVELWTIDMAERLMATTQPIHSSRRRAMGVVMAGLSLTMMHLGCPVLLPVLVMLGAMTSLVASPIWKASGGPRLYHLLPRLALSCDDQRTGITLPPTCALVCHCPHFNTALAGRVGHMGQHCRVARGRGHKNTPGSLIRG